MPALVFIALAGLLGRVIGIKGMTRVGVWVLSRICRRDLEFTGAPPDPTARLIVANHFSYLDLLPLYYLWPDSYAVASHDVRRWLLLGPLLRRVFIFVDNRDAASRGQARVEMRRVWAEDGTVVIFPGSRRAGSPPLPPGVRYDARPFRRGSFEEAISAGITIQGARISYSPELMAVVEGGHFEDRFFWVLCQNFTIRIHLLDAERASGDAENLALTWERRILRNE